MSVSQVAVGSLDSYWMAERWAPVGSWMTAKRPTPDRARAFTRWDTDKDGVLTLEEYRTGLTNPTNAENRFKNFDKDGDGKLTRVEFVTPGPR